MNNSGDFKKKKINPDHGILIKVGANEQVPANAIKLTLKEIYNFQNYRINNWVPKEDVWPFLYSTKCTIGCTALSSAVTILYTRRFFQLHAQRFLTTMIPGIGLPVAFSASMFHLIIKRPIIQDKGGCSLCKLTRSATLLTVGGSILPFMFSFFICIPVSKMEKTYPVPKLSEFHKFFDMLKFSIMRSKNVYLTMAAINASFGYFIADRMIASLARMDERDKYVYEMSQNNSEN